jgi:hypothetical protein
MADETSSSSSSSITGYETPTPQMEDDNATLSSHSSLSDLSHTDTIEPNVEGNFSIEKEKENIRSIESVRLKVGGEKENATVAMETVEEKKYFCHFHSIHSYINQTNVLCLSHKGSY